MKQICTTHDFTELKLNDLLFTFYSSIQMNSPFSCYFLDLGISFPGLRSMMFYVLRKEIKMFFFLILRGIWDSTWKKNRRYKNVISPVHLWLVYLQNDTRDYKINTWCFIAPWSPTWIKIFNPHHSPRHDHYHGDWLRYVPFCTVYHDYCALDFWPPSLPQKN